MLEQFLKNCLPWVGPHAGAGEECEEKGAAERMCDELSPSHCTPGVEEVENSGIKLSQGRREGWGGGVFEIWVYFSLCYSDFIGDKLISQVESVWPVTVIGEESLSVLILTHEPFIVFFLPWPVEEGQ